MTRTVYTPRPNDVVVLGSDPEGDRYLVLGAAVVDPIIGLSGYDFYAYPGYRIPGRRSFTSGWHVQNLTTGALATHRAAHLRPAGKATDGAEGLLPRPRVRLSRTAA